MLIFSGAQTCSINVIDSNGSVMARLGGYGNLTDVAIKGRLAFYLPRSVALSDRTLRLDDVGNLTFVRASLIYDMAEKYHCC